MHNLSEKLRSVLPYLENNRMRIDASAKALRTRSNNIDDAVEDGVLKNAVKSRVGGTICAVDGGLAISSSHEIDIVIARAVGVSFDYSDSNLKAYKYFPSPSPEPEVGIKIAMDESSARVYGSLFRLRQELETAIKSVSHFSPNILLLDGSLAIHPADKPSSENEEVFGFYEDVVSKYRELYEICEKSNCLVAGVSKDSRAKRFSGLVNEIWPDQLFLDRVLKEAERTVALRYYGNDAPAPKALGKWAEKIKLFYLKCVSEDYPLRVEFITENCDLVANTILSLAAINRTYAYPAVLIEADLRAMLDQKEVEWITDTFLTRTKPLRSKARPFR